MPNLQGMLGIIYILSQEGTLWDNKDKNTEGMKGVQFTTYMSHDIC